MLMIIAIPLNAGIIKNSAKKYVAVKVYKYAKSKIKDKIYDKIKKTKYVKPYISKYENLQDSVKHTAEKKIGTVLEKYNMDKKNVYNVADTIKLVGSMMYKTKKRDLDIDDYKIIYLNSDPVIIKARTLAVKQFWDTNLKNLSKQRK